MNVRSIGIATSLLIAAFAIACGGSSRRSGFGTETDPTETADGGGGGFGGEGPGKGSECGINNTGGDPDKDYDGDGYALKDDCNECNTAINKGAHDIPDNGIDEDCSGVADDEEIECDTGLSKSGSDAFDGARAMGLCKKADPDGVEWGVVDAKWVKPDGTSLGNMEGVGILTKLGVNAPQMGGSMLVLSSGSAREPSDPDYDSSSNVKGYTHGTPPGYPKESPACPGVTTGRAQDGVALEMKIRVPSNAQSFSYQQNFFTWEYPTFICDRYNDFFVAMLDPIPDGLEDGNIAFDQDTNPISVNNSLLQVCAPGTHKGKQFSCPLGTDSLSGTGFEGHAATGWLTTNAPVTPGTVITLRFAIWDSGDGALDSTVLIDDFRFSVDGADSTQTKPSPVN
ncbi:MAG: choice-of-anchor L domain-containing protein [Labilithrix sp.]|nr:choice-of-anchor L domain-containing protein [Labilithrix sp.]MBX3222050.1 choice-of-anchor L domain-containing protein [Labilithrix sp.]